MKVSKKTYRKKMGKWREGEKKKKRAPPNQTPKLDLKNHHQ
jgi:hypothetical protein